MAAILVLCIAARPASAATTCRHVVRFGKGADAATVQGTLTGYGYCDFVLRAKAGQQMRVWLTGERVHRTSLVLREPIQVDLAGDGKPVALPRDGEYTVRILMIRAFARRGEGARYSLRFQIR